MTQLSPFLRFNDGTCREAMEFYKGIFGGKLQVMTVGESPMTADMPADKHNLVMHSMLTAGKVAFVGMDMMRDKAIVGDNVGMALDCGSEKELKTVFAALADGGDVFMQPEEMFWGGVFGVVTDKYGVEWMLNFQKKVMKKPAKATKANMSKR